MNGREPGHIYINPKKAFFSAFVILVLFRIPRTYLGFPYLYSIHYATRTIANQGELFGITIVELIAILIGLILYTQKRDTKTHYWPLLIFVIATNLFRYLAGMSNPISLNSYEIFLALLVSLSCGTIIQHFYNSAEELESLLDVIIVLFFVFQLYFIATGRGRNGSYGTVGLSGGGVAICYATYILLKLLCKSPGTKNTICLVCAAAGLILTGSRTQLLLLFLFLAYYVLFMLSFSNAKKWLLIGVGLIGLLALIVGQNSIAIIANSRKLNSLMSIFSTGLYSYVTGDASASERIRTWGAALKVIRQNPLGISCSVVDLQTRMFGEGSTTFPHSFLLAYYLLLGIPSVFIYGAFWKRLVKSKKGNTGITLLLIYIVLILTFYGGISTQYLLIFWLMMIYTFASMKEHDKLLEEEEGYPID
ncbi:MAG: O-antigen ligase family protein [Anaerolineaceae bacterium]|nr:O-antigen ligase family protein [Anaerolineaceae bacterium]